MIISQKPIQGGFVDDFPYLSIWDLGRGFLKRDVSSGVVLTAFGLGGIKISCDVDLEALTMEFYGIDQPLYGLIRLDKTKTEYGYRPWLICPDCNKRRAKLYRKDKLFSCRACLGLRYPGKHLGSIPVVVAYNRYLKLAKAAASVGRIQYAGAYTRKAKAVLRRAEKLVMSHDFRH